MSGVVKQGESGARIVGLPSPEERVAVIRRAMSARVWDNRLARELRAQWGCSTRIVHVSAAEASRQLAQAGDIDQDRRRVETFLEAADACAQRLAAKGSLLEAGNLYVKISNTLATVGGLNRQRVVLEGSAGTDEVVARWAKEDGEGER